MNCCLESNINMHSSFYLQNRKNRVFPYVLVLGTFLLIGLTTTLGFMNVRKNNLKLSLEKVEDSGDLIVTNIDTQQVNIVWKSSTLQNSELQLYKDNKLIGTYKDERDIEGINTKRKFHYFTVKGLQPISKYTAVVIGGTQKEIASFTTIIKKEVPDKSSYMYGVMDLEDKNTQSIVLISLRGFYPLSTLTNLKGEWTVLNQLVSIKSSQNKEVKDDDLVEISYLSDTKDLMTKKISYMEYINNYSLARKEDKKGQVAGSYTKSDSKHSSKKVEINNTTNKRDSILNIIMPEEGASLNGNKPLFKGTAKPGQLVKVKITPGLGNMHEFYIGDDGLWTYVPYFALTDGSYEFSISTIDDGFTITRLRKFIILKSGESVLGQATGEADITITPTEQPIEVVPTEIIAPTEIVTTSYTDISPTAVQEPVSGLDIRIFGSASLLLIIVGLTLFMFI